MEMGNYAKGQCLKDNYKLINKVQQKLALKKWDTNQLTLTQKLY